MSRPHPATLPARSSLTIVLAVMLAHLGARLPAHGGQYRGPGEVVPPSSNSTGGGSGGSSSGSGTGGGAGTGAGTTAGSGGAGGSATAGNVPVGRGGGRGAQLDDDLTRWEFWWEFQKDPFLRLRERLYAPRALLPADGLLAPGGIGSTDIEKPTAADIDAQVSPALYRALLAAKDRDTTTGCMVALAKIGRDLPNAPLEQIFRSQLPSHDQEVRETAALCLGIAGQSTPEIVDLLLALALDQDDGRKACGRAAVDERTRSFATYALGLLGKRTDRVAACHKIVHSLLPLLAPAAGTGRNLSVAVIGALSQLRSDVPASAAVADAAVAALLDYYQRELGPGQQLIQAHCPPAIARLIGQQHALSPRCRELFAADLRGSLDGAGSDRLRNRSNHHLAQSCAMALGELARPWTDDKAPDAELALLLQRCWREHKDHQTRYFAILALGRIGGDAARAALLREVEQAGSMVDRPWAALALGMLVADEQQAARAAGRTVDPDPTVGRALAGLLDDVKNPSVVGGTAIAIGLCQYRPAADALRGLLREHERRDDAAGQIAIALALLEEQRARGDLHALLPKSVRRPQLLLQLAMALGRLGDAGVIDDLVRLLADGDGSLARLAAIASALGQIGDRRSLAPLLTLLADPDETALTRAFAAVALGGVCDKDPLPWNAGFAPALNYRAAVETLTDGQAGILDIL